MNDTTKILSSAAKLHASILRIEAERKRQGVLINEQRKSDQARARKEEECLTQYSRQKEEAQKTVAALREEIAIQERRKQSIGAMGSKKMQEKALGELRISIRHLNEQLQQAEKKLELVLTSPVTKGEGVSTASKVNDELEPPEKLNEREAIYKAEYQQYLASISPSDKAIFEGVLKKYPMDPMVPIKEGNCGGCFTRVLPPLIAKVQLESGICRCDDCGRILYNEHAP